MTKGLSNEDAIEVLKNDIEICTIQQKQACDMAIKALEQTRWIPVSERLPELGEKVLCQCRANIYEVLKLTVDGWYYNPNHCYMESFVIAWMPLPKPYKAENKIEQALAYADQDTMMPAT